MLQVHVYLHAKWLVASAQKLGDYQDSAARLSFPLWSLCLSRSMLCLVSLLSLLLLVLLNSALTAHDLTKLPFTFTPLLH